MYMMARASTCLGTQISTRSSDRPLFPTAEAPLSLLLWNSYSRGGACRRKWPCDLYMRPCANMPVRHTWHVLCAPSSPPPSSSSPTLVAACHREQFAFVNNWLPLGHLAHVESVPDLDGCLEAIVEAFHSARLERWKQGVQAPRGAIRPPAPPPVLRTGMLRAVRQ